MNSQFQPFDEFESVSVVECAAEKGIIGVFMKGGRIVQNWIKQEDFLSKGMQFTIKKIQMIEMNDLA